MTPDGVRGREGERASELQKPFFLYPHPHRKRGNWRGVFVFCGSSLSDLDNDIELSNGPDIHKRYGDFKLKTVLAPPP